MKKHLFACTDCGDDNTILTQVSSGLEIILPCSDCYNLRYSNEIINEFNYDKKIESSKYNGLNKLDYFIFKFHCSNFCLKWWNSKNSFK